MVSEKAFANPPVSSRIKPFWFWNGTMIREEISHQIKEMADKGLGGMFICARQGMDVPYLSGEWFELVDFACREAKQYGLEAWLYDEYPYPSGMSGGEVLLEHPEAEHKILKHKKFRTEGKIRVTEELGWSRILYAKAFPVDENGKTIWENPLDLESSVGILQTEKIYQQTGLTRYNNKRFFSYGPKKILDAVLPEGQWEIQICTEEAMGDFKYYGGFFDPCNREAVKTFLDTTHERYAKTNGEEFGVSVFGMFSDEVGLLSPIPWSSRLPEAFKVRNGYSILEVLPGIYEPDYPGAAKLRYDLYETAHELFRESYHHQVASWCEEHYLLYATEVPSMRHSTQKFSHIPGGDTAHEKLGKSLEWIYDEYIRNYRSNAKAVSSLARQLDRKYAMIESFHSVGWTMNMQDAKWMIDRLGSSGINLYNFHAFYYTIQDITKHDAPPSQFLQNPYWKDYRKLADYVGRMGEIITNTEADIHIAVLDPIAAMWTLLGNPFQGFVYKGESEEEKAACDRIRDGWVAVCKELLFAQLDYDHLDGELLEEAEICDGSIRMGRAAYSVVVLPECHCMEKKTREMLERFVQAGGHVIAVGELPSVSIDKEETDQETEAAWKALTAHANVVCLNGSREALPDCCRGYIREAGRVEVLEGDRKSVIGVCRQDGAGSVYLFAANQGAEPVKVRFSSENGTNSAVWMDLEKGRQIPAENPENKGIAVTLEGFESRWLKLSDFEEEAVGREPEGTLGNSCLSLVQASMMDEGGRSRFAKHISMAGKWKCFPQSLNVCRFGETEVSVDGTNWEKVEVKTFIEQCAQTKRLGGEQIAMEGEFGTPRKLRPAYPIICFYKVGFKIRKGELPSELFLLMDRETISGSNAIEINGRVVEASLWKPVRVNDFNNQAADIRSLVREGENEIRIRVCIRKDEDGLRDPFYLWGSFGVGFEDGCHVLTAQPEQVCPDAPWIQGFPYYSGTMEFETEIEFDSSEACILALDWAYPCHENIEVLVNGRSTGICAYSPYLWECGQGTAKQGMNCVTVRISNTLANMLDGTYFDYKEHRLADIRQEAEER